MTNQAARLAVPQECIKALYIDKPDAQCTLISADEIYCKDFGVLLKDVTCWKVKHD